MPRIMDGEQLRQIFCSDFDLQQWTAFVAEFLLQASCAKFPNLFLHPKERMQDTISGL